MAKIECPSCNGLGKEGVNSKEICVVCKGTGKIEAEEPKKSKKKSK